MYTITSAILLAVVFTGCEHSTASRGTDTDALHRRADEFVNERHQKWGKRAANVSKVVLGVERGKVLELLGEPDMKSDSSTVENWLYNYDCARNDSQIWIDAVIVQIGDGKVIDVRRAHTRMGISEMLSRAEAKAK